MKMELVLVFIVLCFCNTAESGPVKQKRCDLTIKKGGITVKDGWVLGFGGELNQLRCSAHCGPGLSPVLTWHKKGQSRSIRRNPGRVYAVRTTWNRESVLNIRNMRARDVGTYTCRGWIRHRGWVEKSVKLSYSCSFGQLTCDNSRCIDESRQCDGVRDCNDGFDEEGCECRNDQFACDSTCHPASSRCDSKYDCYDGTDELDCIYGCTADQFTCDDNTCIDQSKVCDYKRDCLHDEDEFNCTYCPYEFDCGDGTCIPYNQTCDRIMQCTNGTDEDGCPCLDSEYTCGDGTCIDNAAVCDGHMDCNANEDELKCGCKSDQFTCQDNTCIDEDSVCDGIPDCLQGEDEFNCSCSDTQFRCTDGNCIDQAHVCNGIVDCNLHGEDEDKCPCHEDEFRCLNGTCIDTALVCDGSENCPDGDDEVNCSCNGWLCKDGNCIDESWVCDGDEDCTGGEDEENCQPEECTDDAPAIADGFIDYGTSSAPHVSDTEATVSCDSGYTISGSATVLCTAGSWSELPSCTPNDCADAASITDGTIDYGTSSAPHVSGTEATVSCDSGYTISGSATVTCTAGRWSELPSCTPNDCADVAAITDGTIDYGSSSAPHVSGTEATVSCDSGYTISGSATVICTAGSWSELPTCTPNDCADAALIADGAIDYGTSSAPHVSGTEATVSCDSGYTISGSATVTCTTGSWSELPTCIQKSCLSTEYQCLDGTCIDANLRCDRKNDCAKGQDEFNCTCYRDQFECGDGVCIDMSEVCNEFPDCSDGSDERNCNTGTMCQEGLWRCSDKRTCVRKCDGKRECPDGGDELDCPTPGTRSPPAVITTPMATSTPMADTTPIADTTSMADTAWSDSTTWTEDITSVADEPVEILVLEEDITFTDGTGNTVEEEVVAVVDDTGMKIANDIVEIVTPAREE